MGGCAGPGQADDCSLFLGLEGQARVLGTQREPSELSWEETQLPSGCRQPSPPEASGSAFHPSHLP